MSPDQAGQATKPTYGPVGPWGHHFAELKEVRLHYVRQGHMWACPPPGGLPQRLDKDGGSGDT